MSERSLQNIILCGVGGQGTILAAKILAAAAMNRGQRVMTAETIGMAQRGGSTNDLMRELGKQQFQVRNHMRWASRFDMDELVGILLACEHCDLALKGSEDSDAAFVRLICEFAA